MISFIIRSGSCNVGVESNTKETHMSIKNRKSGEEKAVGRVVKTYSRVERIMSDVWDDVYYAVTLEDDGSYKTTALWEESAHVDASPAMIAAYEAEMAAEAVLRQAKSKSLRLAREATEARIAAEKAAKLAATKAKNLEAEKKVGDVAKGDTVTVKSGKAKGQSGKVMWVGNTERGTKLGVALSDERDSRGYYLNVAWVLKKNVEVAEAA